MPVKTIDKKNNVLKNQIMKKKALSFKKELLKTIRVYISSNLNEEPVDGIFITVDKEITLVNIDDIYQIGDYYPIEQFLVVKKRFGKRVTVPNKLIIRQVAKKYS